MAFISDDVRMNFVNKCDGLLPVRYIEIFVCDALPSEMRKEIAEFQAVAKAEVGNKGKQNESGASMAIRVCNGVLSYSIKSVH